MKVAVDKELCIGCGLCESYCPAVFKMEGMLAIVSVATVPQSSEECAKQMLNDCPITAIKVI